MPTNRHVRRLERIRARKTQYDSLGILASAVNPPSEQGNEEHPFFNDDLPAIYSIAADCHPPLNNLIAFFLPSNPPDANTSVRYELPEGYFLLSCGVHGMASVQDYNIVQRAVVSLMKGIQAYQEGKAGKPGQTVEISLKHLSGFCHTHQGDPCLESIIRALLRLNTTYVEIERACHVDGKSLLMTEGENLIQAFEIIRCPQKQEVQRVSITLGNLIYEDIIDDQSVSFP